MIRLKVLSDGNAPPIIALAPEQHHFVPGCPEIGEKAHAHRADGSCLLAIYADDTPVGVCMYYERSFFNAYQLSAFCIDIAHQGRGYGSAALAQLLDRMRIEGRYPSVRLGCFAANTAARHLYQKIGFTEIDREDDEIILERSL